MLFPAIYGLGYRVGQSLHHILNSDNATNNNNSQTQTCYSDMVTNVWILIPTWTDSIELIRTFPLVYKEWWWNLVQKDPLHVGVETIMLVVIVYLIVSRSSEGFLGNPKRGELQKHKKLTTEEEEELLLEWKESTRAPLAPMEQQQPPYGNGTGGGYDDTTIISTSGSESPSAASLSRGGGGGGGGYTSWTKGNGSGSHPPEVLVHKQHGRTMEISIQNNYNYNEHHAADHHHADHDNNNLLKVLNFATFDFLGMQTNHKNNKVKEISEVALKKYGCGSCGPRGFYGTIDTHLQLELEISKFTQTDGAIMYSDGASTCSSTVAAFAKRGDLLIVDEGCYEPLVTGVMLSRANVKWFKHNDMEDLERVLRQVQQTDIELNRSSNAQRRFIVVEGLYKNLGSICPIADVVALKHKYHYRMILDESFSFGTLGSTGRGILELYNLKHMYDVEIVTIGLENALGSIGGVTVGNEEVVDHQRLSGAGYCFSASAPPFTASAAIQALQLLQEKEKEEEQAGNNDGTLAASGEVGSQPRLLKQLHSNIAYLNDKLHRELSTPTTTTVGNNEKSNIKKTAGNVSTTTSKGGSSTGATIETIDLMVTSDEKSPILVLQLEHAVHDEAEILCEIVRACLYKGVAVVATGQDTVANGHLRTELAPAIRMTVSSLHTTQDMDQAVQVLLESARSVMKRYSSCHRRASSGNRPVVSTTTSGTTKPMTKPMTPK